MSNMYYNGTKLPEIVSQVDVSAVSTAEPASARPSESDDSVTSAPRLCIVLNDELVYDWFEISQHAVDNITIELFQQRVAEFLSIRIDHQVLRDTDGPVTTTSDLRRSLRAISPVVYISDASRADEESPMRTRSPEPYPLRASFRLLKRTSRDRFGFSNLPSVEGNLVISQIDPDGLLIGVAGSWVEVGDVIVSVNGERSVGTMRRQLLVSDSVVLDIIKRPCAV